MSFFTYVISCTLMLMITYTIHSHPLIVSSNVNNLAPSQIDQLCSYIFQLRKYSPNSNTMKSETPKKRFAVPFPDMNRFLSTSHKLHRHESTVKSEIKSNSKKHDFHAYLCSISQDSEEISNFLNGFIQEHGQLPAFNIFESCEQVAKREPSELTHQKKDNRSPAARLNELLEFCSNRSQPHFTKRWRHSVGGPISIDFIHQMLESRKVKSYPYSAEMDPYLVTVSEKISQRSTPRMRLDN